MEGDTIEDTTSIKEEDIDEEITQDYFIGFHEIRDQQDEEEFNSYIERRLKEEKKRQGKVESAVPRMVVTGTNEVNLDITPPQSEKSSRLIATPMSGEKITDAQNSSEKQIPVLPLDKLVKPKKHETGGL